MNQLFLYPIAARPGVRYTVDRAGALFLIHGYTAWSLITGVNAAGVARYLGHRAGEGLQRHHRQPDRAQVQRPGQRRGRRPFLAPG